MKITQHTDDFLTLDEKPWLLGLIVLGMGLLTGTIGVVMLMDGEFGGILMLGLSGLIFFGAYWLVERTQIVFNRLEGSVEIRKKSMRRMKVDRYELKDVDSTTVEQKRSSSAKAGRPKQILSRIILVLNEPGGRSEVPFTGSFTSGGAAERLSPVINEWLAAG